MTHTQTHKLFILLACLLLSATWGSAATYCSETITSTNGKHTATITCSSLGNNQYQFIFTSTDAFTGYNAAGSNFYMNVNGAGGYHVSEHLSQDGNELTALVESSVVPNIYVGALFVQYADGEAMYNIPTDADFSQVCTSSGGGDDNPPAFDPTANLALNKPAVAGKEVTGFESKCANDGNLGSRWAGGEVPVELRNDYTNDWWYVDLGAYYQLTEIDIFWEGAYSMDFVLQGAKDLPADVTDDTAWRTLYTFSGDPKVGQAEADKNVYTVSGAARYVRIKSYANSLGNQWGMSIWEFRVYGSGLAETDETLPVVTAANVLAVGERDRAVTLQLTAEKNGAPVYEFLVKDERNGFSRSVTTSSESNTVRLTGLKPCTDYQLTVVAIDQDYNSSKPVELTFTVPAGNLALGTECSAGFAEAENTAGKAVDGDGASRWSGYGAPEGQCWWQVDLGRIYNITEVDIRFENTWITDYTISVSLDGDTWEPVVEKHENPDNLLMSYEFTAQARYLRISSQQNFMSFYEFEVYGTCDEVLEPGHCVFQGGPGEGLMDEDVRYAFTDGYRLEIWLNETKDKVIIKSEVYDPDHLAGMIVIHRYKGSEVKESTEVFELYDHQTTEDFHNIQIEIPMEKFLKNFEDYGVKNPYSICITVKFVIPGGMRCTSLDYFMLDGSCAERSFIIYHHDDMPSEPEQGALTQFEGGLIMRPIQYKRIFKPGVWETLNLPFEVTKVTVYDPADDAEYDLYAQYTDNSGNTQEGNFWLRTFDVKAPEVMADDFQPNWRDIRAASRAEALPKKGIPYIMMMPDAGGYYDDKYVIFHGKGSQEIAETYVAPALPQDDYFSYSGNNTMMPWRLQSAYVLDAVGAYFESGETVTLQPFECAVNATQATIRRLPRLGLNAQTDVTTADVLPVTHFEGEVYGVMGLYFGAFASLDAYEALINRLPAGFYIVRMGTQITKIYVEGAL